MTRSVHSHADAVHRPTPPGWAGGGHYSINSIASEHAWEWLRSKFPDGKAKDTCWLILSTSGVHGTYATLEDVIDQFESPPDDEEDKIDEITFVCVEPRLIRVCYGNVPVRTREEADWLCLLVEDSLAAVRASQTGNLAT